MTDNSTPTKVTAEPPVYVRGAELLFLSPLIVPLEKDLPRSWERACFKRFRKGDTVTLIGMLRLGGQGCFLFAEGERGGYVLRPDQVKLPEDANVSESHTSQKTTEEIDHAESGSDGGDAGRMVSDSRPDGDGSRDVLDAGEPVGATNEEK